MALISGRMATVSEQFRLAREQQQLDIHQVAEITKIKTPEILAMIREVEARGIGRAFTPAYVDLADVAAMLDEAIAA